MNNQRSLFSIDNLLIIHNKSCYIDWHVNSNKLLSVNCMRKRNTLKELYNSVIQYKCKMYNTNQQFYNTNENETTLRG